MEGGHRGRIRRDTCRVRASMSSALMGSSGNGTLPRASSVSGITTRALDLRHLVTFRPRARIKFPEERATTLHDPTHSQRVAICTIGPIGGIEIRRFQKNSAKKQVLRTSSSSASMNSARVVPIFRTALGTWTSGSAGSGLCVQAAAACPARRSHRPAISSAGGMPLALFGTWFLAITA